MTSVVVVGAQWGDEGKGKVVDLLSERARHVVRSQGGNNAGHTVVVDQDEVKLHLIPSGILHPGCLCYLSAGTVIDPEILLQEIRYLEARGLALKGRMAVSPGAHLIMPYHHVIDRLLENKKGNLSVGTTGRGIGPCYSDKALRLGIRMGELVRPDLLRSALAAILPLKNDEITKVYGGTPLRHEEVLNQYLEYATHLAPYVGPVEERIGQAIAAGEPILFEGAQGTFLDITVGTYPYVTSSNTLAAGICSGAGVGPRSIDHVVGVAKAYTTRVGHGPMPTEVSEKDLFLDHQKAREFGTTTGRKRRVGWFDAMLVRQAARWNSFDSLAITKLDVLDSVPLISLCVGYELDGQRIDSFPLMSQDVARIQPIYETLPGWLSSTSNLQSFDLLPQRAKEYLRRIEAVCEIPISLVSLGPDRHQTLHLKTIFHAQGGSVS